jgi:ADP-ribosyl-[dinitrogen reductase] hydrolase
MRQWLLHDSKLPNGGLEGLACHHSAGFVRYAFTLAFHHLWKQMPFADGICETLCRGGDTDTDAAVVGGLLGALHGAAAIPETMLQPVLAYEGREDQGGGCPRPWELRAARLPELAKQLFQLAGS